MTTGIQNFRKKLAKAKNEYLKPFKQFKLSEFADEHRILGSNTPNPGQWSTDFAPYQREMMDAVSDPTIERIVYMTSQQCGKTATIENLILYHMAYDPASIMVVHPTVDDGTKFSKEKLQPMLQECPIVADKVNPKTDSYLYKEFVGGFVKIIGTHAAAQMAMSSIRILLMDEVDRFKFDSGDEGDPVRLCIARTENFPHNKKIVAASTPTVKHKSKIHDLFLQSDQRYFHIQCIHCKDFFKPEWKLVVWDKDNDEHLPDTAKLACACCGELMTDAERLKAAKNGKWVKTNPKSKIAGFHVSSLISPWSNLVALVEEFIEAKHDPRKLQPFINLKLGEVWEETGEGLQDVDFVQRLEDYTNETLPESVLFLTAGVDVQVDRLEVEVKGWGHDLENWHVDYKVLHGDPSVSTTWQMLADYLATEFKREDGLPLKIASACIDSGGLFPQQAYKFASKYRAKRYMAIKGRAGALPLFPKKASKSKTGYAMYTLGVDTGKEILYSWLRITDHGPSYCHYPTSCDDDYFAQLTSEKRITVIDKNGYKKSKWVKDKGLNNEVLDTTIYAIAAYEAISPNLNAIEKRNNKSLEKIKTDKTLEKVVDENIEENIFINRNKQKRKTTVRRTTSWLNG